MKRLWDAGLVGRVSKEKAISETDQSDRKLLKRGENEKDAEWKMPENILQIGEVM